MKDAKIQWMIVLTLLAVCLGACKDRDTHYEYYDKDGSKPFKVFEVDRATGKMDGSFKQFNRMGILVKEGTYENGLKNGVFKEYSKNGSLVLEGSYDHDLKNGTFKEVLEHGNVVVKYTYKNDFIEGPVKVYRGGKLVSKGEIKDGRYVHTKFFTDPRDGQKYPVVVIGSRVWMAANLNYKTAESHCHGDYEHNCEKYGRLYSWKDAEDACSEGWDIPSYAEWVALNKFIGEEYYGVNDFFAFPSAKMLISVTGWDYTKYGIDAFGFSVLPAGKGYYIPPRYVGGKLIYEERTVYEDHKGDKSEMAYFWSSSQVNGNENKMYVEHGPAMDLYPESKEMWFSVRCIKDE